MTAANGKLSGGTGDSINTAKARTSRIGAARTDLASGLADAAEDRHPHDRARVVAILFGIDPRFVDSASVVQSPAPESSAPRSRPKTAARFASMVLPTQDTWADSYRGRAIQGAGMVQFTGATRSACGSASPKGAVLLSGDQKVYSTSPYSTSCHNRFSAPATSRMGRDRDEVGPPCRTCRHSEDAAGARPMSNATRTRYRSGRTAADCFAGVWGNHADATRRSSSRRRRGGAGRRSAIGDDGC